MTTSSVTPALSRLHQLLARPDPEADSDAQLLARFARHRDEAAFALLVRRHGPMVLGVCRRLLRREQDAEDAFQAALLVLARKAGSVGARGSVAGYLYRVAYRAALRARAAARRRAGREGDPAVLPALPDPRPVPGPEAAELRGVLDEELSRLPEKYRVPVVLCYLEGLSNEQAARQLGWPAGTLKTRLAHARRLLGSRLVRRGLGLGAAMAAASLPRPALVGATVRAAALFTARNGTAAGAVPAPVARLMEGVLRTMFLTKLKTAAVLVAAVLALGGGGLASYRALAAGDEDAPARVERLRRQIADLQDELRRAEQAAARERAPAAGAPVAVIFDVPITREELADHLLRRVTRPQLEAYVNRRILEHAARERGVVITGQEVEAAVVADQKALGTDDKAFAELLRKQYHKSLAEWKEDVIWPRVVMEKLCRDRVRITEQDLRDAYEADFGEKVECYVISWKREEKEQATRAAAVLRKNPAEFDQFSRSQPCTAITFGRHATGNEELERAAFRLRDDEVSPRIETPDGFAVVKCRRRLPADTSRSFEQVRDCLHQEVRDRLVQEEIRRSFQRLRKDARPRLLWHPGQE